MARQYERRGYLAPSQQVRVNERGGFRNGMLSLWSPQHVAGASGDLVDLVQGQFLSPLDRTLSPPRIQGGAYGPSLFNGIRGGGRREGGRMWNPQGAGGFEPGSLLYFGSVLSATDLTGSIICGYMTTGATRLSIETGAFAGLIRAGFGLGSLQFLSGTKSYLYGDPFVAVASFRSPTDYEICVSNLSTARFSFECVTGSTSAGSSSTAPGSETIGAAWPAVMDLGFSVAGNTYLAASWLRGFTREEMIALALDPMQLVRPSFVSGAAVLAVEAEGDLDVTLEAATLSATGIVPATGELAVTLDAANVEAVGSVSVSGDVAVTLEDVGFSITGQVGAGVAGGLGDLTLTLDDATLTGVGTVDVAGEVVETLESASVLAAAVAGTNGPFAQRPLLVLN